MALSLSSADLAAIERANSTLLAPFAYENGESWRLAAARAVEMCVGADASAFVLQLGGEPFLAANPDVVRALQAIIPPPDWLVRGLTVRRRQLGLDVIGLDDAFDIDAVKRTSFYNDVARPQRLLAPLSMVADTGGDVLPAILSLYFTNERAAQRHARRSREMLQLLFPAFRAGLRTYIGFRRHCAAVNSIAEHAAIGVLFFNAPGRISHENEFFRRLMECDSERDRVRAEAARMVRGIVGIPALNGVSSPRQAKSELRTSTACYRIAVILVEEHLSPHLFKAVAIVERLDSRPMDSRELAARFSLTQREIECALLLRNGLSSRDIARHLGISVNTARRHIESILLKLDVHNRTAAAAKLSGE